MSDHSQLSIRTTVPEDLPAIGELLTRAFRGPVEAQLVAELTAEGLASISLVAELPAESGHKTLAGHLLFSPLSIVSEFSTTHGLALSPVAVAPELQNRGIGSALIRAGLDAARAAGERIVIVLGEPGYYRRFGFDPQLTQSLRSPYAGEYFMALELTPGALAGVAGEVRYAPPFARLG